MIETTEGIVIGGFLKKKIMGTMRKIGDVDCFLFTNKSGTMVKYPIKQSKKFDAFQLSSKQDPKLFIFGNDLIVCKEDVEMKSNVNERNCFFEYGKEKNVLIGHVGSFDIKRILVIQIE